MGIDVFLQAETGQLLAEVGDPHSLLPEMLQSINDESFCCLPYIDLYGDTVFNKLQMNHFLEEWRQLYDVAQTGDQHRLLTAVEELAKKCAQGVHLYLKFHGD